MSIKGIHFSPFSGGGGGGDQSILSKLKTHQDLEKLSSSQREMLKIELKDKNMTMEYLVRSLDINELLPELAESGIRILSSELPPGTDDFILTILMSPEDEIIAAHIMGELRGTRGKYNNIKFRIAPYDDWT